MRVDYSTEIDTVGLQVDCIDSEEQRVILYALQNFIVESDLMVMKKERRSENQHIRKFNGYTNETQVASICTGSFRGRGNKRRHYITKYYVSVKFAGLKRHDEVLDKISVKCLLKISAYLKDRNIRFKWTEIDLCYDVRCSYDNLIAICTRKTPKTEYFGLNEQQPFKDTRYVEKLTKKKLNKAVQRAYKYNKAKKDKLKFKLTRFELKLQSKFFNTHGLSIDSIFNALDRYHVMHFKTQEELHSKMDAYEKYQYVRKREIKRLKLDRYRLYPDMERIENFICLVEDVTSFELDFDLIDYERFLIVYN